LETSRLEKPLSPYKIPCLKEEDKSDAFLRSLIGINDFLHYLKAEPFLVSKGNEKHNRTAFKKTSILN